MPAGNPLEPASGLIELDGGANGVETSPRNPDCLDKGGVTGAHRHVGLLEPQKPGDVLFDRLVGFTLFGWSRNGDLALRSMERAATGLAATLQRPTLPSRTSRESSFERATDQLERATTYLTRMAQ